MFIRLPNVLTKTGLSKSTIWAMSKEGNFPRPVKLSKRTVAWVEDEVDSWCKGKILWDVTSGALYKKDIAPSVDQLRPNLLTANQILSLRRIEQSELCGIYFLILSNKIVYVGKSENIFRRIMDHSNANEKEFESFTYIQVPISELDKFEQAYIYALNPKHNKTNIFSPEKENIKLNRGIKVLEEAHQ